MPGIFDRLQAELGDDDNSGGVTPLDIADLPEAERRIMLWMLRDRMATGDGITIGTLNERMPSAPGDILAIIERLARDGWLISLGEPPNTRYKVNLRQKRGGATGFGLWSIVADRLNPND